jgi:hypothetical protein
VPPVVIIRVSDEERLDAWREGLRRISESGKSGRDHARSIDRPIEQRRLDEYVGCLGEIAVAKYLGIPWNPRMNVFHTIPDAGHLDVRATTCQGGRLIIRHDDPPDRGFVFVTTEEHRGAPMLLRGWLWAREAHRDEWLDNPNGQRQSWWAPVHGLRPMDTLPRKH